MSVPCVLNIEWSPKVYNLQELHKKVAKKDKLPLLVRVVEGFQESEDGASFGIADLLLVTNLDSQEQVLLRNGLNETIKLSLSYGRKFIITGPTSLARDHTQDTDPEQLSLEQVVSLSRQQRDLEFRPASSERLSFNQSAFNKRERYEKLRVIREVNEPFFVGYEVTADASGVLELKEFPQPLLMYIPVRFVLATKTTEDSKEQFQQHLRRLAASKQNCTIHWMTNIRGLIMFGEASQEYEPLGHRHVAFDQAYQKVTHDLQMIENNLYSELQGEKAPDGDSKPVQNTRVSNSYVDIKTLSSRPTGKTLDGTREWKQGPKVPPKKPTVRKPSAGQPSLRQPPMDAELEVDSRTVPNSCDESASSLSKDIVSTSTENRGQSLSSTTRDDKSKEPDRDSHVGNESVSVPPSLEGVSVNELGRLLHFWHLGHHAEALERHQVDGELLLELSAKDLMEEFQFTMFEAKKLENFCKNPQRL